MEGDRNMYFSSLFMIVGKGVEMEVYRAEQGQYLCTVSTDSRVPAEIWRSSVVSITPFTTDKLIVFVRRWDSERKDKDVLHRRSGTSTHTEKIVAGSEELEGKAAERAV